MWPNTTDIKKQSMTSTLMSSTKVTQWATAMVPRVNAKLGDRIRSLSGHAQKMTREAVAMAMANVSGII